MARGRWKYGVLRGMKRIRHYINKRRRVRWGRGGGVGRKWGEKNGEDGRRKVRRGGDGA